MLKKKEKVDFSELANVLMYSDQKVLVVYEEEVTKDHSFSEILNMQKQGAEFYLAEEDWESLPVIGPEFDPYDGVTSGFEDAEKECGLPFTAPEEEPGPELVDELPEEYRIADGYPGEGEGAMIHGKNAKTSSVPAKKKGRLKNSQIGKIGALARAGRSADWIADDMGIPFSTALKYMNKFASGDLRVEDFLEEIKDDRDRED